MQLVARVHDEVCDALLDVRDNFSSILLHDLVVRHVNDHLNDVKVEWDYLDNQPGVIGSHSDFASLQVTGYGTTVIFKQTELSEQYCAVVHEES